MVLMSRRGLFGLRFASMLVLAEQRVCGVGLGLGLGLELQPTKTAATRFIARNLDIGAKKFCAALFASAILISFVIENQFAILSEFGGLYPPLTIMREGL